MTELSKNRIRFIRSLNRKKDRKATGLFLVEGDKMVREVLNPLPGNIHCAVETVAGSAEWLAEFRGIIPRGTECFEAKPADLRQVSTLQEPNRVLAVCNQPDYMPDPAGVCGSLALGLENIQDPGNLGTIVRIADWFGVRDIFCSPDCVDLFNPKVIQSTMGSFLRVRVHYTGLPEIIRSIREAAESGGSGTGVPKAPGRDFENPGYAVFASSGSGENLYEFQESVGSEHPAKPGFGGSAMILLGNESRGLSDELLGLADRVLSIPPYDPEIHPESLNVAAATAILCSEFRRQAGV
jgi:TrmH family RNA methyltransferase